jgi:hypothetical protein
LKGIFKKQNFGNVQDLNRGENFEEILENQLNLVFVPELSPARSEATEGNKSCRLHHLEIKILSIQMDFFINTRSLEPLVFPHLEILLFLIPSLHRLLLWSIDYMLAEEALIIE